MINLNEARDLDLYKVIINIFASFIEQQPGTGMGKIYKQLLDSGLKCMPKDKKALEIITYVLNPENAPKSIQDLLNTSFADLPITVKPVYKSGNSKLAAFWAKNGNIYSKVFDLIDMNGNKGLWTDEKGNKIELLELVPV